MQTGLLAHGYSPCSAFRTRVQWHLEGTTRLQLREQPRNWHTNQCLTAFPNGPANAAEPSAPHAIKVEIRELSTIRGWKNI